MVAFLFGGERRPHNSIKGLCFGRAVEEFKLVSGTLPTSFSKKRPYGQGEMLAFFTRFFFAFSKPYYRRNDDFRGSWVTILESFCYSDMPWSIHVPQESPKVGKRVDFRVPPGFLWHLV